MAFLLAKEKEFELYNPWEINGIHCLRTVTVPASIQPTGTEVEGLSENDCARLIVLLENFKQESKSLDGESEKRAEQPLSWDLDVTFGLVFLINENNRDFVRIRGSRKNNILERLNSFLLKHQLKLKVTVKLHKFTFFASCGAITTVDHVESIEADLGHLSFSNGVQLNFSGDWGKKYWNPSEICVFEASITIACFLHPASILLTGIQEKQRLIQKMLGDELNSDVVIIAKNGAPIKCYQVFLSAHSPVFETMFKEKTYQESKTGTVLMPDMTEDGVRAFLDYLYLKKDDKADKNCGIALELLQAAHMYDVAALEESMKCMLLTKPDDWFEVDVAMKLFLFAKNLPEGNPLKLRATKVLKKNFAILRTSETYKQLFKDHPEAAMEFCEYGFSI